MIRKKQGLPAYAPVNFPGMNIMKPKQKEMTDE